MKTGSALSEEKLINVSAGGDIEYYVYQVNSLLERYRNKEFKKEYLMLYYLDLKAEIRNDTELPETIRQYCLEYLEMRIGELIN